MNELERHRTIINNIQRKLDSMVFFLMVVEPNRKPLTTKNEDLTKPTRIQPPTHATTIKWWYKIVSTNKNILKQSTEQEVKGICVGPNVGMFNRRQLKTRLTQTNTMVHTVANVNAIDSFQFSLIRQFHSIRKRKQKNGSK